MEHRARRQRATRSRPAVARRRQASALAAVLGLALVAAGRVASAQSFDERRGPAEIRDDQVLAQPRLTLPAASPDTLEPGRWSIGVDSLWSNTFNWEQDVPGEGPRRREFLIDGETLTVAANARHGLGANWDVGLRLPLRWRGSGVMDRGIDAWHRVFHLPNGNRPDFLTNEFRVEGELVDGGPFSWNDRKGAGLGNVELDSRWRFHASSSSSAAVVGRIALPTGTGVFDGHGGGAAVQVVFEAPLARKLDVYTGVGGTLQGRGSVGGVEYEPGRVHGFLAFEWRPWPSWSVVAETNAASRLVANIQDYPGVHWMLDVTAKHPLGDSCALTLGFTENLLSQLSTTDFAVYAAFTVRR